jgi:predicted ATP-dependent endonuclease of OLD family
VRLSRVVIRNLRALQSVDVTLTEPTSLIIGENNTGKSCFIHALRLCLDVGLFSTFRMLLKEDVHSQVDQTQPFQVLIGVELPASRATKMRRPCCMERKSAKTALDFSIVSAPSAPRANCLRGAGSNDH